VVKSADGDSSEVPDKDGQRGNEKWIEVEGGGDVAMQQLMGSAQAAAARAMKAGGRVKHAPGVKA
jgi:hypothetical protein